jgi:hypothetical protein
MSLLAFACNLSSLFLKHLVLSPAQPIVSKPWRTLRIHARVSPRIVPCLLVPPSPSPSPGGILRRQLATRCTDAVRKATAGAETAFASRVEISARFQARHRYSDSNFSTLGPAHTGGCVPAPLQCDDVSQSGRSLPEKGKRKSRKWRLHSSATLWRGAGQRPPSHLCQSIPLRVNEGDFSALG